MARTTHLSNKIAQALQLRVNKVKLYIWQCRGDLATCESNFAAPGTQEEQSPTDVFVEKLIDAGQNICDVLKFVRIDFTYFVNIDSICLITTNEDKSKIYWWVISNSVCVKQQKVVPHKYYNLIAVV